MGKSLLLGTAQWGWNVPDKRAFQLLDTWLEAGYSGVDVATNYPINLNPRDFRASERILLEYIRAHGLQGDLQVTMKIGSRDNLRTPDVNLSPSFILMMGEEYVRLFGENLHGIMLHWDNRSDTDEIHASLSALISLQQNTGIQPGISGLAHPEVYATVVGQLGMKVDIQLKHNVFYSDLERYAPLLGQGHRFFAYGINGGGVKLDGQYGTESTFLTRGGQPEKAEAVLTRLRERLPVWNSRGGRPAISNMNQIGLMYALSDPHIDGILIGGATTEQLKETLATIAAILESDYSDVELMG